ncbi:Protein TIFY 4B [Acorus calamus]|uniref:Protein TIFY n=1 Tax=Acorus calamus TaxID=4465 RepID=A0AAV9EE86_ACOCL|nr:Protein TIFY 4B [Acorus calamus]
MPETDATASTVTGGGEATTAKSPLEKPLFELTEEDIAQVTREDCRKFLKDGVRNLVLIFSCFSFSNFFSSGEVTWRLFFIRTGMRRPSWNKSQAIQQVISLKALLESRPPSAALRRKVSPPPPQHPPPPPPEVAPSLPSADPPEMAPAEKTSSATPSERDGPNATVGQMTIFYGGEITVFDSVSPDKARSIMWIAGSPPCYETTAPRPSSCRFPPLNVSTGPTPKPVVYESPSNRKASVQRYLEKKKDRVKFKGKRILGGSPNMELYLNHKAGGGQNFSGQLGQTNAGSPTQPRPPSTPTRCSSVDNPQAQTSRALFDLNDDYVSES